MPDPLVIPAGYAQCTFSLTLSGRAKPFSFSIGAKLGSDEQTLAGNLASWFSGSASPDYVQQIGTDYFTQQVEVLGNTAIHVVPCVAQGADTHVKLPPGMAAKIKKTTNVRGKANKGYMFWPGILSEGDVDEYGELNAAVIANAESVLAALTTAISTDGSAPYILHRALSSVTTPTPINFMSVLTIVRSQRRRQIPR